MQYNKVETLPKQKAQFSVSHAKKLSSLSLLFHKNSVELGMIFTNEIKVQIRLIIQHMFHEHMSTVKDRKKACDSVNAGRDGETYKHTYTAYSAEICSQSSCFHLLPKGDFTSKTHPDKHYVRTRYRKTPLMNTSTT